MFLGLQKDHTGQMDQYLVHGDSYKALRDALGKAILECKPLAIETALEVCWTGGLLCVHSGPSEPKSCLVGVK